MGNILTLSVTDKNLQKFGVDFKSGAHFLFNIEFMIA